VDLGFGFTAEGDMVGSSTAIDPHPAAPRRRYARRTGFGSAAGGSSPRSDEIY
jgi:hypothetical protein